MDHASDEQKNASYINFKEGDPYFDYKSVFNSTFFIEAEPLLKNHSLLEPTWDENKYLEPIGRLHQKFRQSVKDNQERFKKLREKDTIVFGVNLSRMKGTT